MNDKKSLHRRAAQPCVKRGLELSGKLNFAGEKGRRGEMRLDDNDSEQNALLAEKAARLTVRENLLDIDARDLKQSGQWPFLTLGIGANDPE
jgi:hypothetical protein